MPERFGKNIHWREEGERIILSGEGVITRNQSIDLYEYFSSRVIVIEEGVTGIEGPAFREFHGVKEVILPKSLRFIGSLAFFHCDSLEKIGPLPPINRIAKDAFHHSGYKMDKHAWDNAGPMVIDLEVFPYRGDKDELRIGEEYRPYLLGETPRRQLMHYEFTLRTAEADDLTETDGISLNYDALERILVDEDGLLLGISFGSEYSHWIFLMAYEWIAVEWRSKMEDTYPWHERYVPVKWYRPYAFCWSIPEPEEADPS